MKQATFISILLTLGIESAHSAEASQHFVSSCGLQGQAYQVEQLLAPFSNKVAKNLVAFALNKVDGDWTPESCLFVLRSEADRLQHMLTAAPSTSSSIIPIQTSNSSSSSSQKSSNNQSFTSATNSFDDAFNTIRVDLDGIEAVFSGEKLQGFKTASINGRSLLIAPDGRWAHRQYVPEQGLNVEIELVDRSGSIETREFFIQRGQFAQSGVAPIQPKIQDQTSGRDRVAVIIGVDGYRSLPAATFAEADALSAYKMFNQTFNIPASNIKDLIGSNANEVNIKLAFRNWLTTRVDPNKTELYIYYAGHGLADDKGEQRYWMPHDAHPQLLDDTAISFGEVMGVVDNLKPAKTFVVADSCYSGASRSEQPLTAQRPIRVVRKYGALPDNTFLFAATQTNQSALPYEEAQHGLFSYWWLKGLEGEADLNGDRRISAGELSEYTRDKVSKQSGGTQVPDFDGNPDEVILAWDQ